MNWGLSIVDCSPPDDYSRHVALPPHRPYNGAALSLAVEARSLATSNLTGSFSRKMPLPTLTARTRLIESRYRGARIARVRRSHADWRVREAWRELILGPEAPDWLALENAPCAVSIKAGRARTTWRVTVGSRILFAKVLDESGFLDRLKRWVAAGTGRREWRTLLEAESRGVPVVRCLAMGARSGYPRRVALVFEAVPGATNLAEAWERNAQHMSPAGRRAAGAGVVDAVARLFAVAHERGFVHGDPHADNVLVHPSEGDALRAVFLDVHSARLTRRPASLRSSLRSLAQLDQHFRRRATRTERLRFLRDYVAQRPSISERWRLDSSQRDILTALRRASASHAKRLARTRDRRLRRNGRYFATLSLGEGCKATVVLRLERRHLFPEPDMPDRTQSEWRAILAPLVETMRDAHAPDDVLDHHRLRVEIRRVEGLLKRLLAAFRGPAQRRVFERCHKRRHRDVPDGLILACVEHRSGGLVDATVLIRPSRGTRV